MKIFIGENSVNNENNNKSNNENNNDSNNANNKGMVIRKVNNYIPFTNKI